MFPVFSAHSNEVTAMGIRVSCPNGHVFKVKDKYAGKKGLCPHCEGQVIVRVPDLMSTASKTIQHKRATPPMDAAASESGSIFDDPASVSSSGSVIQHKTTCNKGGKKAPMWFARCPACGEYLDHG